MVHVKHYEGYYHSQEDFVYAFKKWLVAMTAGWFTNHIVNHTVLVLVGKGGIFKTTLLEHLLPPQLSSYFTNDSSSDYRSKDFQEMGASKALVNLDEFEFPEGKNLSAFKSMITKQEFTFYLLLPKHESEAYWEEIEEGARKCEDQRRDFHINLEIKFYERSNEASFCEVANEILEARPEGVVVVPASLAVTREFTEQLHHLSIPFILLDSYMPDLRPLSFFGQDSFCSGYFAAKMLCMIAGGEKEVMLMRQTKDGQVMSKQQDNREVGFRHYMHDHFPQMQIHTLDLPLNGTRNEFVKILEKYFAEHSDTHHCITMTSKAHIVGDYLLKSNRRDIQIMGYDMVEKNARCLREGSISFLIAQHAFMQGYYCVDTLFQAIVLKKKVTPVNYMPIELLMKENVDFYRRTQI